MPPAQAAEAQAPSDEPAEPAAPTSEAASSAGESELPPARGPDAGHPDEPAPDLSAVGVPTASTGAAQEGAPSGPAPLQLSRRQVLKLGLASIPALVGAGGVFQLLSSTLEARSGPDALRARYDAAAHRWGFVVDASSCIGCGSCVVACKEENNVPTDSEHTRTWVERHVLAPDGSVEIDSPDAGIKGFAQAPASEKGKPLSPATRTYFVPRLCMQCEASPCTSVCPVGATFHTADGVVLVDADRCIGCGYCVEACPYGARYLVPAGPRTPQGIPGVADKCTFCYHRITRGLEPACVEVCPVGARIFGDLNDPSSRVSTILLERPTKVMKAGLGTHPRVHYLGLEDESV